MYVGDLGRAKPLAGWLLVVLGCFVAFFLIARPSAQDLPAELADGGVAVVRSVIDGDTVQLEDGREVRLVGVQAPKLPLGRKGFEAWPLAGEAKRQLEDLILGRAVRLAYGGLRTDRHRRQLAHLYREDDGLWVQGAILASGMGRTYSFPDNRALVAELLEQERAARADRLGIWDNGFYRILDHRDAAAAVDQFAVVEGRVVEAAVVRGRGFLNFGADFRDDFTVTLAPDTVDLFASEGVEVEHFEDRRIRVRGWVQWRNGPSISATHPEQIELLD